MGVNYLIENFPVITYDAAFQTGLIQVIPDFKLHPKAQNPEPNA